MKEHYKINYKSGRIDFAQLMWSIKHKEEATSRLNEP